MQISGDKHNSREALLAAAHKLFIEKGYESVSTRELAEEAGVNLGAIQYHFGSKGQLFVETMKTLMEGEWPTHIYALLDQPTDSPVQAAGNFAIFVRAQLEDLLADDKPQPCKMMVRELFTPTSNDTQMFEALVSTVTENFIRPVHTSMSALFRLIAPGRETAEYQSAVHNTFSQCFFYLTHGPFIERLRGVNIREVAFLNQAAGQITKSVLRELCCSESLITQAAAATSSRQEI